MTDTDRLKVVFLWHMHQPQYRDLASGDYRFPWTYLHAIKDYTDMAAHLEAEPAARAVVNFAPLLLEQIADYAGQVEGFLRDGGAIRDFLLAALAGPALPAEPETRRRLVHACLGAHESHMIARFPPYRRLARLARWIGERPEMLVYVNDQFLADLVTWYHLAWLGETVRRTDARVRRLLDKGGDYTPDDRRELLDVIGALLAGVVGRYARLAEQGRVELSVSPYAHPIVPLLVDLQSARAAMPDAPLPARDAYPGGVERARWHLREGVAAFERHFGFKPAGCWPSEGGVCAASLKLAAEAGFTWAASGEGVLRHSLHRLHHADHALKAAWLYRPYAVTDTGLSCFFRDDELSDQIGFAYATWHADDAVANLVHRLEQCADACRGHTDRIVSIVLDGENAWEHYPENGYYFLSALYRKLAEHPRLVLTTFSDYLETHPTKRLRALVPGSWVYGTFSTWIGDSQKNRGWEMLADAKREFDRVWPRLDEAQRERALRQLAVCEGSDWFWWFGDYNPAATVSDFERLYRLHLSNLYRFLGVEPPAYLAQPFAHGRGAPAHGGTMRPGQEK